MFLESAVPLAKSLRADIAALGKRLENAALAEEDSRRRGTTAATDEAHYAELLAIVREIKSLLARIEKDIPTLQLAISACGETFSSTLPTGVSPSRFLQASFFLNLGDTQFASDPSRPVQVGPSFYLSLYMLFVGHAKNLPRQETTDSAGPVTPDPSQFGSPMKDEPYGFGEGERKPIWQEVLHKARVRLCRTPMGWQFDHSCGYVPPVGNSLGVHQESSSTSHIFGRPDEYSYHLEIVEDLNDGRVHEDDSKTRPFGDISEAGIRESIPIHQIAKIFYTDSGRILNIGNSDEAGNNPILLLKRDPNAPTAAEISDEIMTTERQPPLQAIEDASSVTSDEQDEIDRQLRQESQLLEAEPEKRQHPLALHLPSHLDPEWLALEVFAEDDESDSSASEDEAEDDCENENAIPAIKPGRPNPPQRCSLDAALLTQLKNLSTTDVTRRSGTPTPPQQISKSESQRDANFVARSPFSSITSSLSLMEMLIRLTSLQEFQQAAHLSIPDYILSFFMEETSTTGLQGEERWKTRSEAKRRVGFDPYTDTPTK